MDVLSFAVIRGWNAVSSVLFIRRFISVCLCVSVCVFVCVKSRKRERERAASLDH